MQLESTARIEKLWKTEDVRAREKQHPQDFPALPEIPVGRYTRDDFFQLEIRHLWPKTWLLVGIADELPTAGSYRSYTLNGAPVVVVRGKDNAIRAFYNVCQHRGATLVTATSGTVNTFNCRYHCWSYRLDGALEFVPDEHDFAGLDRSKKSLRPLRCELWGNLIFICFDPAARPLADHLGGLVDALSDVPLDKVRLYTTLEYDVACNWKCIHDAFSETYHVKYVHAGSVNMAINPRFTARYMFPNGHNGMTVKARGDATSGMVNVFDRSGNAPPEPGQMKEITRMGQRSYNIFPNVTMPIAEDLFPAMSLWPLAPDRTRFEIRFLKIPAADGSFDTQVDRDTVAAFDAIAKEDLSALEDMQSALASGGIDTMPLCYGEQFLYNFHRELDRVIGKERVPGDLAVSDIEIPLVGAAS